eukprot:356008-Chlamydomonas_euryale.AAC.4
MTDSFFPKQPNAHPPHAPNHLPAHPQAVPACALCPVTGGLKKRTTDGRWAHVLCAMWVPETGFQNPLMREPIEGCDKVGGRSCCTACDCKV